MQKVVIRLLIYSKRKLEKKLRSPKKNSSNNIVHEEPLENENIEGPAQPGNKISILITNATTFVSPKGFLGEKNLSFSCNFSYSFHNSKFHLDLHSFKKYYCKELVFLKDDL